MADISTILQTSLTPVALISGIGLLLLSMTNRYGRLLDRIRDLKDHKDSKKQISFLYKRAIIQKNAISFSVISIFFITLLILLQFYSYIVSLDFETESIVIFSLALISLIISLALFLSDVKNSLHAISLDLRDK